MQQYLINSTAIWLISLFIFDVFLRRESYHNYNRFYLLSTFVLGLVLPVLQWHSYEYLRPAVQRPVENIIAVKETIATTAESAAVDWAKVGTILYIAGACVAMLLLIADIVRLARYYTTGSKSCYNSWTIVTTGKAHAPFSFRKTLFVNSREQYSTDEWEMLFVHEREHTRLVHLADLVLMQMARIVFWFHPLVYVYNKRLLMVHEYQADNAAIAQPSSYGQFLVEQAVLGAAPNLSHSFNRSPIKKRIIMLTRRSTTASKTKMLTFIPVALVSMFCFSQNGFSQKFERNGSVVTYRGNTFEFSKERRDTVEMEDKATGKRTTRIMVVDAQPQSMNGKPIPGRATLTEQPMYTGEYNNLRAYMLKKAKADLTKLDDGIYKLDITNVVVDEKGKIVYFDYGNMRRSKTSDERKLAPDMPETVKNEGVKVKVNMAGMGNQQFELHSSNAQSVDIDKDSQQRIFDRVCKIMNDANVYRAAKKDGKATVSVLQPMEFFNQFKIEHNKLYDLVNGKWVEL